MIEYAVISGWVALSIFEGWAAEDAHQEGEDYDVGMALFAVLPLVYLTLKGAQTHLPWLDTVGMVGVLFVSGAAYIIATICLWTIGAYTVEDDD